MNAFIVILNLTISIMVKPILISTLLDYDEKDVQVKIAQTMEDNKGWSFNG